MIEPEHLKAGRASKLLASQFGQYAVSLAQLGPPASGSPGASAAEIIPKGLADGKASGYIFSVTGIPADFAVTAVPETFNSSGHRTFYSDQTLVIRQNWSEEPANANSPELK